MKIVYNIYVAVRKLWNAIFGKNGDGSQLVIPGRISGASGDVTVGEGLELDNNVIGIDGSVKKMYLHSIRIANTTDTSYNGYISIDLITNSQTALSKAGLIGIGRTLSASGNFRLISTSTNCPITCIIIESNRMFVGSLDNIGNLHDRGNNAIEITDWFNSSSTAMAENIYDLN